MKSTNNLKRTTYATKSKKTNTFKNFMHSFVNDSLLGNKQNRDETEKMETIPKNLYYADSNANDSDDIDINSIPRFNYWADTIDINSIPRFNYYADTIDTEKEKKIAEQLAKKIAQELLIKQKEQEEENLRLAKIKILEDFASANIINFTCPYKILQVSQSATRKEIRTSYVQLARFHPDRFKSNMAHEVMTKITDAYHKLTKPEKTELFA